METTHQIRTGDARDLDSVDDDSVALVVTSPPYPMVEMWDDLFTSLDPAIGDALAAGDGRGAFRRMHAILDPVWTALKRVLVDGGIACINVGDATRTVADGFRVYGNHARIRQAFVERGFEPLPEILWRKPVNSTTKFLGSGMVPPNAYVTLEHEFILVFRNGPDPREFEPGAEHRYQSAYFWEERNRWFSDVWTDIRGEFQSLEYRDQGDLRNRSGAFPFEVPYRLANMFSVYGDTVLDPFWGTGTTSIAAMVAARDSIGVELDPELISVFEDRVGTVPELSRSAIRDRLEDHRAYVERRTAAGEPLDYEADHYEFPVTTAQETPIRFFDAVDVRESPEGYRVVHEPVSSG